MERRLLQGDGARLPFRGEAFDFVLSHEVIEHVYAADLYLAECHRVLRPGGVLYLSTAPYSPSPGPTSPGCGFPSPSISSSGGAPPSRLFRFLGRHAPSGLAEKLRVVELPEGPAEAAP